MVIRNDPEYEKRRAVQQRLEQPEDERKEELIAQMREEPMSVLGLAMFYAKNFEKYGVDITEKWITTQQQMAVLQQIFNRGYEEGLSKGRGLEREQIEKNYILTRKPNPYIGDGNGNADSFFREDKIPKPLGNLVQPANEQHRRNCTKKRRKRK